MNIIFKGSQSTGELSESVVSILKLLRDKYGVANFQEIDLHIDLLDQEHNHIELVDGVTHEPIRLFEIYKTSKDFDATKSANDPVHNLTLVVDNTKKK